MFWITLFLFFIARWLLKGVFKLVIVAIAILYIYHHYPNVLTDLQHFLEDL
jgi:hypothetical protein